MEKSSGANLERLLVRQTCFSVILLGLLDQMIDKRLLTMKDILAVREFALNMSADLQNSGEPHARSSGIQVAEEIEAFMEVVRGASDSLGLW